MQQWNEENSISGKRIYRDFWLSFTEMKPFCQHISAGTSPTKRKERGELDDFPLGLTNHSTDIGQDNHCMWKKFWWVELRSNS